LSLTYQRKLSRQARRHVANGRRDRLADPVAVDLIAFPEPSKGDQCINFQCSEGTG
jgi:hypothetical protein